MPVLLFWILFGVAGWLFYKKFVKDAEKLSEKNKRVRKEQKNGADGTLVKDPVTGEYRVKRDDE
ncbi:hypothetical protein ACU5AY_13075 [Rhizobium sp. PAMB 3174]|jgi:membrane protein implicated in regulation of membrane protease activity